MFTYVYKSFGHGSQIMNCPNLFNFIHTGRNDFFDFCFILQLSAVWKGGEKFAKFGFTKLHGFTAGKSCKNVLKFVIFFSLKIKLPVQHHEN